MLVKPVNNKKKERQREYFAATDLNLNISFHEMVKVKTEKA